ncbi:hypothetical protein Dimus_008363 [Dionaea muscipula]
MEMARPDRRWSLADQNYRHSSRTLTIIFVLSLASAARRRGAITAHHREARRCPSPIIPHHHLTSSVSLTIITNLHRPERDHAILLTCRRRATRRGRRQPPSIDRAEDNDLSPSLHHADYARKEADAHIARTITDGTSSPPPPTTCTAGLYTVRIGFGAARNHSSLTALEPSVALWLSGRPAPRLSSSTNGGR